MKLTLIHLPAFVREWDRLGLDDDDLRALEVMLIDNPGAGDVMTGTGGLRKVRFAPPSWSVGKRGGARICYAHFPEYNTVYLVTIFPKNERANLSKAERNVVRGLMSRWRDALVPPGGRPHA